MKGGVSPMEFSPILILAVIWLLIGLPLSKLGKKQQQAAKNAKPNPTKPAPKTQDARPDAINQMSRPAEPARPTVLQPTITFTEHDDSVYQGSLNAVTGEGYDPCHNEQLAPLTLAETAVPAAEAAEPGLQLSWTGSDVVRGFVMSEILKRKNSA